MGRDDCRSCKSSIQSICVRSGIFSVVIALVLVAIPLIVSRSIGGLEHVVWYLAAAAVIALLAGLLIGIISTRRIKAPVEALRDEADTFAKGEFSTVFDVDDGPTEVCDLADSLNTITQSTRSALGELKTEEQRQRQFVSDVSHEIRTPLTGIRGNAETLLDPDMPPQMRERFVSMIIGECDRLTRLANDLLALQRVEATDLDLHRINLRELTDSVIDTLTPLFESRGIEVSTCGEAPDVLGDADQLTQVLVNLLENASRFAQAHVHVELAGLKGQSVITVTDDGPGFGDIDPSRLFDRFYRGDASRSTATGGSGLGLAIVKTIVTAHDGTVEAFNLPKRGACFAVGIPSIAPR